MKKSTIPIAHRSDPKKQNAVVASNQQQEAEEEEEVAVVVENNNSDLDESYDQSTELAEVPATRRQGGAVLNLDGDEDFEFDKDQVQNAFGNLIPTSDEAFIPIDLLPELTTQRLPLEIAGQVNLLPPTNGRKLNCAIKAQSLHDPNDFTYYSLYVGSDATRDKCWKFIYFFPFVVGSNDCYYDRTWRKSPIPLNIVIMDLQTKAALEGLFFGIEQEFLAHMTFQPFGIPVAMRFKVDGQYIQLFRLEKVVLLGNCDEMSIAQTCQFCDKRTQSPQELFHRCSACKWAWYCSKQCQANHWAFHMRFCELYQDAGSTQRSFIEHMKADERSRPYEMVVQRDLFSVEEFRRKSAQNLNKNGRNMVKHVTTNEAEKGSYLDEVD